MLELRQTEGFEAWLGDLPDERARDRINARIGRLERGLFGDVKSVGGGVSEMRLDYGPGYRLYFTRRGQVIVILLCGGDKGSQAKDIRLARSLAQDL